MKSFEMRIKANRLRTVNLVSTSASRAAPGCTYRRPISRKNKHVLLPSHATHNNNYDEEEINFYRTQVDLGSNLWVSVSLTCCWDFSDATLADEDPKWWTPVTCKSKHLLLPSHESYNDDEEEYNFYWTQAKWGIAVWLIYWRNFTCVISGGFIPSYISHQQKTR